MNLKSTKFIQGEKWWGGCVSDGVKMPISIDDTFSLNLYEHTTHNQTMPLFISNKGRVIWCDDGFIIDFKDGEITVESNSEIILEETNGNLQSAYKLSEKYTKPCQTIIPEVIFKVPQYNSWIELMYDQSEEEIIKYANSILENGYQPGILMIDDNWQEDYGVWEFSAKRFNDPKKMMEILNSKGFEVMLWVCPFISPDCQTFRYLEEKGFLVKDKRGGIAIKHWWNGYSAILDFTNPDACNWFQEKLDFLVTEYGVKGFKFDAGDLWHYDNENDVYFQYAPPLEQVRLYSEFSAKYEYNELRTGFKTANCALSQRLCDKGHSWGDSGVASLIPNGLMQNMLGYKYNCPDMIGGGEYKNFLDNSMTLDEELVVRYAQIAALFPIMQFSASPWRVLSNENNQLCYKAACIHLKFAEYLIDEIKVAISEKMPIMQHMAIAFPDGGYEDIDTQFMIGRTLLVAPATKKGEREKIVYLPAGKWESDLGEIHEGGCELIIQVPLERLPYFIKKS